MARHNILLETGTNEVEVLEFYLGDQSFGVNVLKVRRILKYLPKTITPVPESYHSILGTFLYHGVSTSVIDLKEHLKLENEKTEVQEEQRKIVLVCELNSLTNGFIVDGVNRIHRQRAFRRTSVS